MEEYGRWRDMQSAPRDGTRILAEIRASEQGPAEVDLVRWAKPEREAEERWVSAESDPGMPIFYAETEVTGWMPLPTPLPRLRSGTSVKRGDRSELDGSGI